MRYARRDMQDLHIDVRDMQDEICKTCRSTRYARLVAVSVSLYLCLSLPYFSIGLCPLLEFPLSLFDTQTWSLTGRRRRQAWTSPLGGATSSVQFIRQSFTAPVLFPTDLTHIRHLSKNLRPTPWLSTSTSASTSTSTITSGTRAVAGGPSVLSLHPPCSATAISEARLHTRQHTRGCEEIQGHAVWSPQGDVDSWPQRHLVSWPQGDAVSCPHRHALWWAQGYRVSWAPVPQLHRSQLHTRECLPLRQSLVCKVLQTRRSLVCKLLLYCRLYRV